MMVIPFVDCSYGQSSIFIVLSDLKQHSTGIFVNIVKLVIFLFSGMNEGVPLTLLLPNNTVVADLLETTFGAQTAATILTFSLAPDKVRNNMPSAI